jgi:hypothetical protein
VFSCSLLNQNNIYESVKKILGYSCTGTYIINNRVVVMSSYLITGIGPTYVALMFNFHITHMLGGVWCPAPELVRLTTCRALVIGSLVTLSSQDLRVQQPPRSHAWLARCDCFPTTDYISV